MRILIVDDDRDHAESIADVAGFETLHSGWDAQPCGEAKRVYSRLKTKLPGPQCFEIAADLQKGLAFYVKESVSVGRQ